VIADSKICTVLRPFRVWLTLKVDGYNSPQVATLLSSTALYSAPLSINILKVTGAGGAMLALASRAALGISLTETIAPRADFANLRPGMVPDDAPPRDLCWKLP
jgi:hypothetical protein